MNEGLPSNSNILFPNKVGKTLGSGEKDCVGDVVDPRTDHRQAEKVKFLRGQC